ncbi:MAG: amidohydrolase [Oscillospiraceae bacterium]|nr:amidohydrolase [Oscillospiraceae bacterium]
MKTLFKNCDIIATENGDFKVIKDGYLAVDGAFISYVGKSRPEGEFDAERDMSRHVLAPGLINCHCHSAMTLLRGVGSDLPLQKWLFDAVFPIEDRLTAKQVRTGSELAMLEMLSTGTTSFSDMYQDSRETIEAAIEAGMKANIHVPVLSFDPNESYADNVRAQNSLALAREFSNAAGGRVRAQFCVHAEYTCNEKIVRAYAEDCLKYGSMMHIHLSETKSEHDECVKKYGKTPAQWFKSLGAFDVPSSAAHCVWATPEDIDIFAENGVTVVHNPTSNLKLGSGIAPVSEMLKRGVNVTLGTDGAASNNNLNMFEEMHLAALIHKGFRCDPTIMTPHQILKMATVNGALQQGRADTGSLEAGKRADIIAISLDRPHMYPAFDDINMLIYSAQGGDVTMTMVDGRVLYENGEFKTIDAERVMFDARRAVSELYEG